jgi:hypothetical protein
MFWRELERVRNLCQENHKPPGGEVSSFELLPLSLIFLSFFFFVLFSIISRATKLGKNNHFKLPFALETLTPLLADARPTAACSPTA